MQKHRLRLIVVVAAALVCPALGAPIDVCGTLTRSPRCVMLQSDAGPIYGIYPNAGDHQTGEHVRIVGEFDPDCVSPCSTAIGCITSPMIGPCTPACRADFDRSGIIGVQDIFAFLVAYFTNVPGPSPPGGDFDNSGTVSVNDIFTFLVAYFTGCP